METRISKLQKNINNSEIEADIKKTSIPLFLIKRILSGILSLVIITFLINSITFLSPPRERALLIFGSPPMYLSETEVETSLTQIIEDYGFDKPLFEQYKIWVVGVFSGNLGLGNIFGEEVIVIIKSRIPITLELLIYSILFYIPIGILFGAISGWRENKPIDIISRFTSYVSFSIPPFILSIIFISIFYVTLGWFMPDRIGISEGMLIREETFVHYTRFLSIDGFLNNKPEVSIDAIRRLVMPAVALSFSFLGTLLLVTRKSMIAEIKKDYITSAYARGLTNTKVLFNHALKNAILPSITASSLMITSMLTELYIIERVFNRHGLSELMFMSMIPPVNIGVALGFALYNFLFVYLVMFIFDILTILISPNFSLINGESK